MCPAARLGDERSWSYSRWIWIVPSAASSYQSGDAFSNPVSMKSRPAWLGGATWSWAAPSPGAVDNTSVSVKSSRRNTRPSLLRSPRNDNTSGWERTA